MRIIVLSALALGAFATSGVEYEANIDITIRGGTCGDNVAVETALAFAVGGAMVTSRMECGSMGTDVMHYYLASGLTQSQWMGLDAYSVSDAHTAYMNAGGVGTVVSFDVSEIMTEEDVCGGGSIYVDGREFMRGMEMTNGKPVFTNGNEVVFYNTQGQWVWQGDMGDPTEVSYSCGAPCDMTETNARIESLETALETCQAGGGGGCSDNLRLPILVHNEWWFCDELIPSDCNDQDHGEAVQNHCPGLCNACGGVDVCDEQYHTKVLIPGVGSLYCDQLYIEECTTDNIRDTCCRRCA